MSRPSAYRLTRGKRDARGPWIVGALLCIVLVLAGCSAGASEALQRQAAAASPKAAAVAATSGSAKTSGDVALTVNSVQFMDQGTYVSPKDGNVFLVIDVTLENQGQQEVTVGTRALTLKDATGTEYRRSMSAGSKPSPDSTLPPGSASRGELAYEVPKNVTGLQLTLAVGQSAQPAVFEIKP